MDNNPFIPPRCLSLDIIAYRWNINYVSLEGGSVKGCGRWKKKVDIFISVHFGEHYVFLDITDLFPKCLGSNPILPLTHVVISKVLLSLL